MKLNRVLIMAGGTGGHVFPAIAIAKKLEQRGCEILWLGTRGRMEEKLVPEHGFNIKYINVQGIRGNGILRLLKAPFMILKSVNQSKKIIKEFKPDLCIGMGGYASGPGGFVAKLLNIPLILHEQNAKAGLTNKILAKFATRILLGFKGAFEGNNVSYVGNPVRESIVSLYNKEKDFKGKINILVVGGSLGAKALNENLPTIFKSLKNKNFCLLHQTGKGNKESVKQLYEDADFEVRVLEFIKDMDKELDNAHLIVCRAGALTVAEVSVCNLPAIFVPLPTAVDDHQTLNAMSMVNENASLLVPQKDMDTKMKDILDDLLEHKDKLEKMSLKTHEIAIIDSTDKILSIIDNL